MLRRPRPGETDEDLLRQEEELVARGELRPSVKLVKPDKRKTEDTSVSGVSHPLVFNMNFVASVIIRDIATIKVNHLD